MDRVILGQRGRVCVGGGGTGGRVDCKMTGGGSGVRQSASRRSTIESDLGYRFRGRTLNPNPDPDPDPNPNRRTQAPFPPPRSEDQLTI